MIVGGGLAGCFMAAESIRAGHTVYMYDKVNPKSPSRVAAGLYNVITGRVTTKTWMAEPFLEALHGFFREDMFQSLSHHLHPMQIYRPYKTIGEANEWFLKSSRDHFKEVARHRAESLLPEVIHNPFGGLEILPCGWVDTTGLVRDMKDLLARSGPFFWLEDQFPYESLTPSDMYLGVLGEHFDEVIFTEGPQMKENPWFGHLKMNPLKGQVMEIEVEGLPEDRVILRKVFLLPRGDNRYVVGSTYEKNFTHSDPTPEGISALENYIKGAIRLPFKILDVRAGIRQSTYDRRPVVGRHPDHPGLIIFNGLGSKGVLQAPWIARHLRRWLDGQDNVLLKEIRLERFRD